jgi:hypothetical protein
MLCGNAITEKSQTMALAVSWVNIATTSSGEKKRKVVSVVPVQIAIYVGML